MDHLLSDRDISFPEMLARLLRLQNFDVEAASKTADLDDVWLSALIKDQPVAPDLAALRSLAGLLGVAEPSFVAEGIRYILEKEGGKK